MNIFRVWESFHPFIYLASSGTSGHFIRDTPTVFTFESSFQMKIQHYALTKEDTEYFLTSNQRLKKTTKKKNSQSWEQTNINAEKET